MSGSVYRLLGKLAAEDTPQTIYSYKVPKLLRFSVLTLAGVLVTYGVTFTDVITKACAQRYEGASDEEKHDWWFLTKTYAPMGLIVIPFTVATGALGAFSRFVTKVNYIPRKNKLPLCEMIRGSAILGRPISTIRPLNEINRTANVRIYTGNGKNGMEDKGTFVFYLVDRSPETKFFMNKFYILSRSGEVWNSDSRVLMALFGNENANVASDKSSGKTQTVRKTPNLDVTKHTDDQSAILNEMVRLGAEHRFGKAFHSTSEKHKSDIIKSIVNKK